MTWTRLSFSPHFRLVTARFCLLDSAASSSPDSELFSLPDELDSQGLCRSSALKVAPGQSLCGQGGPQINLRNLKYWRQISLTFFFNIRARWEKCSPFLHLKTTMRNSSFQKRINTKKFTRWNNISHSNLAWTQIWQSFNTNFVQNKYLFENENIPPRLCRIGLIPFNLLLWW